MIEKLEENDERNSVIIAKVNEIIVSVNDLVEESDSRHEAKLEELKIKESDV